MWALAYTTLILANLLLILSNRSWTQSIISILRVPNKAMLWVMGGGLTFLIVVLYVPALQKLFGFSQLNPVEPFICLGAAILSVTWFEIYKAFRKGAM